MAIIEAWWAQTTILTLSPAVEATNLATGITLKGVFKDTPQTTIEGRFVLSHERLGLGPGVRCLSPAVAMLEGNASGAAIEEFGWIVGTPHVNLKAVLRQQVLAGGQVLADATEKTMLYDLKGDGKKAHVALKPLAFPPVAFHTPAQGDVEIVLTLTFDPFSHESVQLPWEFGADVRLQLPQWGVITNVA